MLSYEVEFPRRVLNIEMPEAFLIENIDRRSLTVLAWRYMLIEFVKKSDRKYKTEAVRDFVNKYPEFGISFETAYEYLIRKKAPQK